MQGSPTPTGIVRFLALGTNYGSDVADVPLVNGRATTPAIINLPTNGSYTVTAEYVGDAIYSPSNSAAFSHTAAKLPSFVQLSSSGASIGTAGGSVYGVNVGGDRFQWLIGDGHGATLFEWSRAGYADYSGSRWPGFLAAGDLFDGRDLQRPAVYSGDGNWMSSASNAISQTVLSQPAILQMTHTTQTLSLIAGATTSNTDTVAVTGSLGFTGTANLTCTVVYNGTGTANDIPQCLMTKSSQALNPAATSFQSIVTIDSIARQGMSVSIRDYPRREGRNHFGEIGLCALVLWLVPIRPRNWRTLTTVLVLITGLTALSGCGGGKGSSAPAPTGTTPALTGTTAGSYTVTIAAATTATGVAVPAPLTIALTIN